MSRLSVSTCGPSFFLCVTHCWNELPLVGGFSANLQWEKSLWSAAQLSKSVLSKRTKKEKGKTLEPVTVVSLISSFSCSLSTNCNFKIRHIHEADILTRGVWRNLLLSLQRFAYLQSWASWFHFLKDKDRLLPPGGTVWRGIFSHRRRMLELVGCSLHTMFKCSFLAETEATESCGWCNSLLLVLCLMCLGPCNYSLLTYTEEQYYCCNSRQNDGVLPRKKILVQYMMTVNKRLERDNTPHHIFNQNSFHEFSFEKTEITGNVLKCKNM